MGHIKEPDGVDFVINSRPLTKDEEIAISKYIRDYKAKNTHKQVPTKRKGNTSARKKSCCLIQQAILRGHRGIYHQQPFGNMAHIL